MRLGLIGTGPQAERYTYKHNGAARIVARLNGRCRPADLDDFLRKVDAVIVATHPAGHRDLCLAAISNGKPVLVEKPLALSLEDCERIIETAERNLVPLEVAHTNLWHESFPERVVGATHADVRCSYLHHDRDYSAWLDWGPHVLSMLEATGAPSSSWTFGRGNIRREMRLQVMTASERVIIYTGREAYQYTPMLHMLDDFCQGNVKGYDFQRRVYRALFAEEEKQNG